MMGQRRFATKLYYQLSLDQLVPQDHLLRQIASAVDFSFVRPLCRPFYSHTGQPSVDPVVLLKMLLVGYLYGITSARRLAREVSLNLAYRWFLGYAGRTGAGPQRALQSACAPGQRGVRGVLPSVDRAVPAVGPPGRRTGVRGQHAHSGRSFDAS